MRAGICGWMERFGSVGEVTYSFLNMVASLAEETMDWQEWGQCDGCPCCGVAVSKCLSGVVSQLAVRSSVRGSEAILFAVDGALLVDTTCTICV